MKKMIPLLLTLVLCLSLCACSKEPTKGTASQQDPAKVTEQIVITTENWQEYLELKQVEDWQADERGCCVVFTLGLKDEYAVKQISDLKTLDVEWSGTWVYRKYTCNKDEKTYEIGDIIESYPAENESKQSSFHPNLLNLKHFVDKYAVMVVGAGTDYYTYTNTIEQFEVISANGVIHFE